MNGLAIMRQECWRLGANPSTEDLEVLLWEFTGWPCWWRIGIDGDTPEECLRTQAREVLGGIL